MILFFWLLIWRISLFAIGFITLTLYKFTPQFPYSDIYLIPAKIPQWAWTWANFDGVHYLTIARSSYMAQYTQAFFPLYPFLVRFLSLFDKGNEVLIITGLFISYVAFIGAVVLFRKLLLLDYEQKVINQTLVFLLIFPTSFYFGALYTESLFFLLIIAAFWFARTKRWWMSGICGALASATRITGILLLLPLLWEAYKNSSTYQKLTLKKTNKISKTRKLFSHFSRFLYEGLRTPVFYIVPLGLVVYMIYLQYVFDDALYFWHAQSVFGANRSSGVIVFPLQVVWRYLKILSNISVKEEAFWVAFWELMSLLGGVTGLLVAQSKKIRTSYVIFGWLTLILPVLTGTLSSLPRYILPIFPMYIILGMVKKNSVKLVIMVVFTTLLIYFTSHFIRGLWVA